MPAEWYIAINGQQSGPHELAALPSLGLRPDTLAWHPGMPNWLQAASIPDLAPFFNTGNWTSASSVEPQPAIVNPPPPGMRYVEPQQFMGVGQPPPYRPGSSDRVAAGICAMLFGWAGIHKFILGLNQAGWITLVISFITCGIGVFPMAVIGFIEGIIYFSKSDQEFYEQYTLGKRQWF